MLKGQNYYQTKLCGDSCIVINGMPLSIKNKRGIKINDIEGNQFRVGHVQGNSMVIIETARALFKTALGGKAIFFIVTDPP